MGQAVVTRRWLLQAGLAAGGLGMLAGGAVFGRPYLWPPVTRLGFLGQTVPLLIVMALSNDPVGAGLVVSLSQPGGNVTGLCQLSTVLTTKRLELLKESLPGISRVAVLLNASNPAQQLQWTAAEAAARTGDLRLQLLEVRGGDDFPPAFQAAASAGAQAMFILDDGLFPAHRPAILELGFLHRLPVIYSGGEEARLGALIGYGSNLPAQFRRAATFVDKILKGAMPADLPIEQPSTFDFVVNLKTAQWLGLAIPRSVLQQATEIVQ